MSELPAIFISHSSDPEPDQVELIEAFRAKHKDDCEILLDHQFLEPGDQWRRELHTWMAICDAALVIFSAGVRGRPGWVLQEATILNWRRALDPRFKLIPILLPGVKRQDFAALGFEPLLLNELQWAAGEKIEDVLAKIEVGLQEVFDAAGERGNPMWRFVDNLAATLKNLSDDRCAIEARVLGDDPLLWHPKRSRHHLLARRLIDSPFSKAIEVIERIQPAIKSGNARDALNYLAIFWVNPKAVLKLPEVASAQAGQRAAALNAVEPFTGELYVRRAFCNYPPGYIVATINDDSGELAVKNVERQLRDFFRTRLNNLNATEKALDRRIRGLGTAVAGEPFFVILAGRIETLDLLTLQSEYPRFTFILATGETLPADAAYARNFLYPLTPEVNSLEEAAFHDQLCLAQLKFPLSH